MKPIIFARPAFSVIVPVCDAAATIAQTVASILAQTEPDFELILIDDGSCDDSLPIMLRLAAGDQRIRLVSQANVGASAARNYGIGLSRARLIAFCDAGDLWHPHKLAQHRAFHARHPGIAVSYGRIAFLEGRADDSLYSRTQSTVPQRELDVAAIVAENPVHTCSNLVVTRSAADRIGGFAADLACAEDQEWLARAASMGERIAGIDELLVGHRLSSSSLSVNLERVYEGWRELVVLHGAGQDVSAAEAVFCRYLARRSLRSGNAASEARRYALRGLSLDCGAFLSDMRQGCSTLFAALAAGVMPSPIRHRVFA